MSVAPRNRAKTVKLALLNTAGKVSSDDRASEVNRSNVAKLVGELQNWMTGLTKR